MPAAANKRTVTLLGFIVHYLPLPSPEIATGACAYDVAVSTEIENKQKQTIPNDWQ
jgi:hypothetical protein